MSYPSKGGPSDDCIKYPPEPSERPRPRAVWMGLDGQHSSSTRSGYGDSSVQGEAVEVHSVDANGVLLAGQAQYGVSPPGTDRQMFPLLAKKFEEAVEQNEELRSEIDRLTQCCNTYIGEADKAVKDMKARHRAQLNKEKTRAIEMQKLYEDTLKQYEDAKIVVLSYKSKNIELEGHIRGLTGQLEEAQKAAQRGASGSPRELERLRREVAELKNDNQACLAALRLKDEDLREMCDKRDVCKKSFQQAADERDNLAVQVAQLQRRLAELDSSSNKKELSALRMRLQESQVSNTGLQEQLKDLKQQLQSASMGSLLQQQEAQGLTAAMEECHERDLLEQKEQVSQWKVRCQQAEEQVRSIRGEVETLTSEKSELQTTVNGMKKALDTKEELIRDLQAEKSTLESVTQELRQSAQGRPSDREADRLTMQLKSAEERIRRLESELSQLRRDAGRLEQQSPTSPAALMPQTRQMIQLMDQLEEAKRREKDLEQECEHLCQKEAEMSRELSSSREKTEDLRWHLGARESEVKELSEQIQNMKEEMVSMQRTLNVEHESLKHLKDTHKQEKQQLEFRVEQTEGRYREYRQELKHHAQALKRVSEELQMEQADKGKLKAELDQCRQELRSLEKTQHELKEEQSTSNLLREQLKQYVSDFQMEKQGHQRTVQDKRALEQRVRDLEKEVRHLQQAYDSRQQAQPLSHLYKVDSQDEPARMGRPDQFTEIARPAPPMFQTANRPGSAAQVPKAGGIQPPGGGTRRDPTAASQAYIHPPAPGGGVQDQRGAVGEDPAARRHPCPICGRTFPDLQKLERHASNCNGN